MVNIMKQPHRWAKEIKHFVDGGEVEQRFMLDGWGSVMSLSDFECSHLEFRIKPTKKTLEAAVFQKGSALALFTQYDVDKDHVKKGGWKRVSDWVEIEYEGEQ